MEKFRRKMDDRILIELKNKIADYLENNKLDVNFFKANMDLIGGLYVENSIETGNIARMSCRAAKPDRPAEIMIDKQFVMFDANNEPINIDKALEKLIKSQLGHELLHAATKYNDNSGIISNGNNNRGLNEGITQMITEKIFGYTVSPNSDNYRDYKKVAKILSITFGEKTILNSYFNHSNNLEQQSNSLSTNSQFFDKLNYMLTSMYFLNVKRDSYYRDLQKPIYDEMNELVMQKMCAEIIVPKLQQLTEEQQKEYIGSLLESVKDDEQYVKKLLDTIKSVLDMKKEEKDSFVKKIDRKFSGLRQKQMFIDKVYDGEIAEELVTINSNGKMSPKNNERVVIENTFLKEKVLSQMYFQGKKYTEKEINIFEKNAIKLCKNTQNDSLFSFGANASSSIEKRKLFSAVKVAARNNGYIILNALEECDTQNELKLRVVRIPDDKSKMTFQELKSIYEEYSIEYDSNMNVLVNERINGKKVEDVDFIRVIQFVNLWVMSAGVKWVQGDKFDGETYAFSEASEKVFKKISRIINDSLMQNGTIDTQSIYSKISSETYKHAEEIIYALLKNQASINIVSEFYRLQNPRAKIETELPDTASEFIMNQNLREYRKAQVEKIIR